MNLLERIKFIFLLLLVLFPTFAFQISPSLASYHRAADIEQNKSLKDKKIPYKETRKRKHSKNKSNLKNQVGSSCQSLFATRLEVLPTARTALRAIWNSTNNTAYIFGGYATATSMAVNEILQYNPATSIITTKSATLPTARYEFSAVWNPNTNKAYILGGYDTADISQILEYDVAGDSISTKTATLPVARYSTTAVWNSANNKAYIFGGRGSGGFYGQILEYNPGNDTLTVKTAATSEREAPVAVFNPVNNKIYIFGGSAPGITYADILEYDPANDTITTKSATLPSPGRNYASAVWNSANNKIYIFGGSSSAGFHNQILEYDPSSDTLITRSESLSPARYDTSAVWNSNNNTAYIIGGGLNGSTALDKIVAYSPCVPPLNPSISSVTVNGIPQSVTSSYRITNGQSIVVNISSSASYGAEQVSLVCNPSAGTFTSTVGFNGTGRLELTPTASNVGMTFNYTVRALSSGGAFATSNLTFSIIVTCGDDSGCLNGQSCIGGTCCTPCAYSTLYCSTSMLCSAALIPVSSSPSVTSTIPATTASAGILTPTPTPIPTPSTTSTPIQNITNTNSGSTTNSQGTNVSTPQVNPRPPLTTNDQNPPINNNYIDASLGGVVPNDSTKQPSQPTPKPSSNSKPTSIDFSKPELYGVKGVNPDSTSPYIDVSKGELKSRK